MTSTFTKLLLSISVLVPVAVSAKTISLKAELESLCKDSYYTHKVKGTTDEGTLILLTQSDSLGTSRDRSEGVSYTASIKYDCKKDKVYSELSAIHQIYGSDEYTITEVRDDEFYFTHNYFKGLYEIEFPDYDIAYTTSSGEIKTLNLSSKSTGNTNLEVVSVSGAQKLFFKIDKDMDLPQIVASTNDRVQTDIIIPKSCEDAPETTSCRFWSDKVEGIAPAFDLDSYTKNEDVLRMIELEDVIYEMTYEDADTTSAKDLAQKKAELIEVLTSAREVVNMDFLADLGNLSLQSKPNRVSVIKKCAQDADFNQTCEIIK